MRSRFHGSKRVRKRGFFEKYLDKTRRFVQNLDKVILFKSVLFVVLFVLFLVLFVTVYGNYKSKREFEDSVIEFAKLNSETVFEIDNLTLYSSASATDSSDGNGRIDISQFTDISFTIKNIKNKKIEEFSIVDISFSTLPELGTPTLTYKNPLEFGKLTNFDATSCETINFEVLNYDENIDYSKPYVLNNLSNPITLEYINKNVKTNFGLQTGTTSRSYDGRLLKEANINFSNIACRFSFHILILTSDGQNYNGQVIIDIPLKQENASIYDGSILETDNIIIYPFYRIK